MTVAASRCMRRSLIILALLVGCESAKLPVESTTGTSPQLVKPNDTLIPTVHVAPAVGWKNGEKPVAADGYAVNAFATGLDHPRYVYVLPNGDVLVSETNAPKRPD